MCNHHCLYKAEEELTTVEVKRVLDSIHLLGTNSIIVSGGEPLARPDLADILRYAKDTHKFRIGLLTNGLRLEGNHPKAIDSNLAEVLKATCSWVQLSIDSFDPHIYSSIRKGGSLDEVRSTIDCLHRSGFLNLEVCFTIQKLNIEEILAGASYLAQNTEWLPKCYNVRFKFAHGTTDGREFLCSEAELKQAVRTGAEFAQKMDRRFDFTYLETMINRGVLDYCGIAKGQPVARAVASIQDKDVRLPFTKSNLQSRRYW